MNSETSAFLLLAFAGGALASTAILTIFHRLKKGSYSLIASKIILEAEKEVENLRKEQELIAKRREFDQERELEKIWQNERKKMTRENERLKQREDKVEARLNHAEKKLSEMEAKEERLSVHQKQLDIQKNEAIELQKHFLAQLEEVSQLSCSQAKEILLSQVTNEVKTDSARLTKQIKEEAQTNAEQEATRIIATAINRVASTYVADATVSTVSLPNEEIKGRIIGREGRNIRTLEQATGVTFVMDDTPGAIVLSAFDPVRRHIGKQALIELIQDGRIHPTRIEEVVEKATKNVNKQIKQHGEDASLQIGAVDLHPELIQYLGKLKFRYSLGQNVLDHSLEVAYLMGIMAAELHLDIAVAKRIGLLHDIGKALTHEVDGPHAIIGHDLALRLGESPKIANGIGCHHNEMPALSVEASLCSAADALSAARPGARVEAVGQYIKRLQQLENLVFEFPGVDKAYALQAGREVRIAVLPDMIDDIGAINLARDVAKKIEKELHYSGKIKITVIREKRTVEYAI